MKQENEKYFTECVALISIREFQGRTGQSNKKCLIQ